MISLYNCRHRVKIEVVSTHLAFDAVRDDMDYEYDVINFLKCMTIDGREAPLKNTPRAFGHCP